MQSDVLATGYNESFTRECFRIKRVLNTIPYTYILEDLREDKAKKKKPEIILGSVYSHEIVPADEDLCKELAK